MARNSSEERLPTAWVAATASDMGARGEVTWAGNDVVVTMVGAMPGPGGLDPAQSPSTIPWELTWEGSLDTDYPTSGTLSCRVPGSGLPRLEASDEGSGVPTGTEADVLFAAIGVARDLFRRRRRDRGGDDEETGDPAGRASTTPAPADGWRVTDPGGLLTPELMSAITSWPASEHARSARFDESTRIVFEPALGTLTVRFGHRWGADVCRHQVDVAQRVVQRLLAWG
jgi:hypothetical protein